MTAEIRLDLTFNNISEEFDKQSNEQFINWIKSRLNAADCDILDWNTWIEPGDPEWDEE